MSPEVGGSNPLTHPIPIRITELPLSGVHSLYKSWGRHMAGPKKSQKRPQYLYEALLSLRQSRNIAREVAAAHDAV